jgi:hypothetical protein
LGRLSGITQGTWEKRDHDVRREGRFVVCIQYGVWEMKDAELQISMSSCQALSWLIDAVFTDAMVCRDGIRTRTTDAMENWEIGAINIS